jgi:hypothetical protein
MGPSDDAGAGDLMRGGADAMRALALALPEAEERETWGDVRFRVRDKMFVVMGPDGREATVKATREEQQALIHGDPETYYVPSYVGQHGWIGVRITRAQRDELRELVTEAWRMTAPKRLVAAFDAEHPGR